MVKPPLRTKSIGFKVSEEEYTHLETAARTGGFTLGEWCRQVVLEDARRVGHIFRRDKRGCATSRAFREVAR
jgi:hypothetical protein